MFSKLFNVMLRTFINSMIYNHDTGPCRDNSFRSCLSPECIPIHFSVWTSVGMGYLVFSYPEIFNVLFVFEQ